jgi:hypothetical protein
MGKEKALEALTNYCKEKVLSGAEDKKVCMMCRLLFVNPKGWPTTSFGMPVPETTNGWKLYPIFPLAVSDKVPFSLVRGYAGDGRFENPFDTIQECQQYSIVPEDLAITNYAAAASNLVGSAAFNELFPEAKLYQRMVKFIFEQAGATNR